jgi:polyphosphate kinase 2 (PPK2 family)
MSATTLKTANFTARFCPVEERKFWKYYMRAYEECLSATRTQDAA